MEKKYIAFISYRHRFLDSTVAMALHRKIESYTVPATLRKDGKRRLGRAFRDREELTLGTDLDEKIRNALDDSRYLIVVCTPDTPNSYWCGQEIDYFLSRYGRENILIVLADGTPESSIPPQLRFKFTGDGTPPRPLEPLCADLVSQSGHLPIKLLTALCRLGDEFLRLVAAMLDCNFDDLKQRRKRRNRNILLAAATAALIIIGMLATQNITIRRQNIEISEQKVQIEQQLQQTLLNESEALALISTQLMEEGNCRSAVETALQAVPHGEIQRPYSAAAEYALSSALYAYQESGIQFHTLTEQETDIIALDVSADGNYAVTLDLDGCIRCLDTGSQTKRWSYNLRNWNMDPVAASAYVNTVHVLDAQNAVLCVDQWAITLLSLEDGSVLQKQEELGAYYGNITEVSTDGSWLSLLFSDTVYLYHTGTNQIHGYTLPHTAGQNTPLDICFSRDGTICAALFSGNAGMSETEEFTVVFTDLQTPEAFFVTCPVFGEDACIAPLEDNRFLIAYSQNGQYSLLCMTAEGAVAYEKILNVTLPSSTYHSSHPADSNLGIYTGRIAAICSSSSVVCLAYDNTLLCIDPGDGNLIQKLPLNSRCLWAGLTEENQVIFLLADGTIRSWMPETSAEEILMDCGFPLASGRGIPDASGYVVVPQDNPSQCLYLTCKIHLWGTTLDTSGLPGEKMVCRDPSGSRFLIHAAESGTGYYPSYTLGVYDSSNMNQIGLFPVQSAYFSSQGTHLLQSHTILDIASGESREQDYGASGVDFIGIKKTTPLSDQREGKPLLTAGLSDGKLVWWQDGDSPRYTMCPCPEMTVLYPDPYWDSMEVGYSGLIAMQYSDSPEAAATYIPCPATVFAIFDTAEETWTLLDNPSINPTTPARLCVGVQEKRVAIVDEYGILRLYDLPTDSILLESNIQIAAAAIDQMNFIQNDRFLIITQVNGWVCAVDMATGETKASWLISGYDRNCELLICEDASRLYFCETRGNINGLYIDIASWTVIADIPGLACMLPATGQILRIDPKNETVSIGTPYTLEELATMAKNRNN